MNSTPTTLFSSLSPEEQQSILALARQQLLEEAEEEKRSRARQRFDERHGAGSVDRLLKMAGKPLSEIAPEFGLSVSRLSILWHDLTGKTYRDYLYERQK